MSASEQPALLRTVEQNLAQEARQRRLRQQQREEARRRALSDPGVERGDIASIEATDEGFRTVFTEAFQRDEAIEQIVESDPDITREDIVGLEQTDGGFEAELSEAFQREQAKAQLAAQTPGVDPGDIARVEEADGGFRPVFTESFRRERAREQLLEQSPDLKRGDIIRLRETDEGFDPVFHPRVRRRFASIQAREDPDVGLSDIKDIWRETGADGFASDLMDEVQVQRTTRSILEDRPGLEREQVEALVGRVDLDRVGDVGVEFDIGDPARESRVRAVTQGIRPVDVGRFEGARQRADLQAAETAAAEQLREQVGMPGFRQGEHFTIQARQLTGDEISQARRASALADQFVPGSPVSRTAEELRPGQPIFETELTPRGRRSLIETEAVTRQVSEEEVATAGAALGSVGFDAEDALPVEAGQRVPLDRPAVGGTEIRDIGQLQFDESGQLVGVEPPEKDALRRDTERLRDEFGPVGVGLGLSRELVHRGSSVARETVEENIRPSSLTFGVTSRAAGRGPDDQLEFPGAEIGTDFVESAVGTAVSFPRDISESAETAGEATSFTRGAIEEEGVVPGSQTSLEAGAVAGGQILSRTAEAAQEDPVRFSGSLVGGALAGTAASSLALRGLEQGIARARAGVGSRTSVDFSDLTTPRAVEGEPPLFETSPLAPTSQAVREVRRRARAVPEELRVFGDEGLSLPQAVRREGRRRARRGRELAQRAIDPPLDVAGTVGFEAGVLTGRAIRRGQNVADLVLDPAGDAAFRAGVATGRGIRRGENFVDRALEPIDDAAFQAGVATGRGIRRGEDFVDRALEPIDDAAFQAGVATGRGIRRGQEGIGTGISATQAARRRAAAQGRDVAAATRDVGDRILRETAETGRQLTPTFEGGRLPSVSDPLESAPVIAPARARAGQARARVSESLDDFVAGVEERTPDAPDMEQVLFRSEADRLPSAFQADVGEFELPGLFASPDASPLRLGFGSETSSGFSLRLPKFAAPERLSAFEAPDIRGMPDRAAGSGFAVRTPEGDLIQGLGAAQARRIEERTGGQRVPDPDTPGAEFLTSEAEPGSAFVRARGDRTTELEAIFPPGTEFVRTGRARVDLPEGRPATLDVFKLREQQPQRGDVDTGRGSGSAPDSEIFTLEEITSRSRRGVPDDAPLIPAASGGVPSETTTGLESGAVSGSARATRETQVRSETTGTTGRSTPTDPFVSRDAATESMLEPDSSIASAELERSVLSRQPATEPTGTTTSATEPAEVTASRATGPVTQATEPAGVSESGIGGGGTSGGFGSSGGGSGGFSTGVPTGAPGSPTGFGTGVPPGTPPGTPGGPFESETDDTREFEFELGGQTAKRFENPIATEEEVLEGDIDALQETGPSNVEVVDDDDSLTFVSAMGEPTERDLLEVEDALRD